MPLEAWEEMETRHARERAECLSRMMSLAVTDLPRAMALVGCSGLDIVAQRVCGMYGVRIEALRSALRVRDLTVPRQHAFYLAQRAGYGLSDIGRYFGRDHTTVKSGIRAHEARRRKEQARAQASLADRAEAARPEGAA